jgi:eukaryotic-like serine/threonine-protein kinase
VVHRDVSPQSVMVSDYGRGLLVDFGVAKAQGAPGFLQSSCDVLRGKVRYLAPEVLEIGAVSPASDVFSAVTLSIIEQSPLQPASRAESWVAWAGLSLLGTYEAAHLVQKR